MRVKKYKSELGAVFTEAAIAVPVFFIVVMLFLDFSRYVAARSVLNASAQEALALAAVIQGVEGNQNDFEAARLEVRQTAYSMSTDTFVSNASGSGTALINNVVVDLPEPGPRQKALLESEPVSITISGEFEPLFPLFPNIAMEVKAAGYREPRSESSLPREVDCNNRESSSPYYGKGCPCSSDTYSMVRNAAGECQCSVDTAVMADGSCGCIDTGGPVDVIIEPSNRTRCGCSDNRYQYDRVLQSCVCKTQFFAPDPSDPTGRKCLDPPTCQDPDKHYGSLLGTCFDCDNYDEVRSWCTPKHLTIRGHSEDKCYCDTSECRDCSYAGQAHAGGPPDDCKCSCGPNMRREVGTLSCVCNLDCPTGQIAVEDRSVLPWACSCEDEASDNLNDDDDHACDPSVGNCNGGVGG